MTVRSEDLSLIGGGAQSNRLEGFLFAGRGFFLDDKAARIDGIDHRLRDFDEGDVVARFRERAADHAAHCSRTDDCDFHIGL